MKKKKKIYRWHQKKKKKKKKKKKTKKRRKTDQKKNITKRQKQNENKKKKKKKLQNKNLTTIAEPTIRPACFHQTQIRFNQQLKYKSPNNTPFAKPRIRGNPYTPIFFINRKLLAYKNKR